jgi:1-acyl-sn-glycerol-3-phosphate acyltransferase
MSKESTSWPRRLAAVSFLMLIFLLLTGLALPMALIAAVYDLISPWQAALRLLATFWFYLFCEVIGVLVLLLAWFGAGVGASRQERLLLFTARIQQRWTAALLGALRKIYRVGLEVEGLEAANPGPILILIRHSSLADTLLPVALLSSKQGLRLRYVIKRELLWDPCVEIAGNRLPNYFVDRHSENRDLELQGIADLTNNLSAQEGVLIYPEGTRFSPKKLERAKERLTDLEKELASSLQLVLPPRLAGVTTLLDAAPLDVVFIAHHGLEFAAHWRSVWRGAMIGQTLRVKLWCVFRPIPTTHSGLKRPPIPIYSDH